MLKSWTILSSGSEGLMHAAMGNAHWIKTHYEQTIAFRRFDGTADKSETLLGFLDTVPSEGIHLGIFDNIYMRRITRFRVLDGRMLRHILTRLVENTAATEHPDILLLQTVEIAPTAFDLNLSHACGHTLKMNRAPLSQEMFENIGGVCVTQRGAKRLTAYIRSQTHIVPQVYYFPEPVVTHYQWNYEISH